VHAFEVDRSLEGPLLATLGDARDGERRVTLHFQDVLKAPLEDLDPVPTSCASNLPYSVAGPFMVEALQRLPSIRRYCVMVQREVARAHGGRARLQDVRTLSVWVQLYARIVRVARFRGVSSTRGPGSIRVSWYWTGSGRNNFLLRHCHLEGGGPGCFRPTRKTLVNALVAGLELPREPVASVVVALGLPADVRAERLTPGQFVALVEGLQLPR